MISSRQYKLDIKPFLFPCVRTMQLHKQKLLTQIKKNVKIFGKNYDSSPIYIKLIKDQWGLGYEDAIKCNIAIDAVALNPQVYEDDKGKLHNVILKVDKDGNKKLVPIKYAFAYYLIPIDHHFKSFLLFFQESDTGNAGDLQKETLKRMEADLKKQHIHIKCDCYDGDRSFNCFSVETFTHVKSRFLRQKLFNGCDLINV